MNLSSQLKRVISGIWLMICSISAYPQSAISTDNAPPPPGVILYVKGSSNNTFHMDDFNGRIGINMANPTVSLDINGGFKIESPLIGTPDDYVMSFQSTGGNVKGINPLSLISGTPHFTNINMVTANTPGDLYQDDFIFGADNLLYNGNSDHYSKFFFDVSKSAFRAGFVNNLKWDPDSLGNHSTAIGFQTKASSDATIALGKSTTASGARSSSWGENNVAGGFESFALGKNNRAAWSYNFLAGVNNQGNRNHTVIFGEENAVNGDNSIAMGYGNVCNHAYNYTFGSFNTTGQPNITAIGTHNNVTGTSSLVSGSYNTCSGLTSTVMGDHINMLAYQSLAIGTELNTVASYVAAFGHQSRAVQNYSMSMGDSTLSSALYSSAFGYKSAATGWSTIATGDSSIASGRTSFAFGDQSKAKSAYEIVIGTNNTSYNPAHTFNWNDNDRLFTIGRGPISLAPYNALVVKKTGKVGIDEDNPNSRFVVNGYESDGVISTIEIISEDYPDTMRMDGNEIDGIQFLSINANSHSTVSIGTDSIASGYSLAVGGKIAVTRMRSQIKKNWPDYVFQPDYKLMSADEIEGYIRENGHLPGFQRASEIANEGLNLSDTQRLILEKIEELTLHIIEMEKKLKILEANEKTD